MDDRPAGKRTKLLSDTFVSPPRVPSYSLLLVCKLNRKECMPWVSSTDVSWRVTSFWSAGLSQAYFTTTRLLFLNCCFLKPDENIIVILYRTMKSS